MKNASVTSHIAVLSGLFISQSVVSQSWYYSKFGIDIYSFLETSELLVFFIVFFLPTLLTVGLMASIFFIVNQKIRKRMISKVYKEHTQVSKKPEVSRESIPREVILRRRVKFAKGVLKGVIILFVFSFSLMIVINYHVYGDFLLALFMAFLQLLVIIILATMSVVFQGQIKRNAFNPFITELIVIFFAFLVFTLVSIMFGEISAQMAKRNYGVKKIQFEMADKVVVSDSSNYFIGQTRNYIFMYNPQNSSATAIKLELIKNITFINKKD